MWLIIQVRPFGLDHVEFSLQHLARLARPHVADLP
jgi:hypothetical protein